LEDEVRAEMHDMQNEMARLRSIDDAIEPEREDSAWLH
jgi:hypothetical protein